MQYGYDVKIDGKWYKAGEEVRTSPASVGSEQKTDKTVQKHTKSEIQLMKVDDLKSLAESEGIENARELSGAELKKILIEHFNL